MRLVLKLCFCIFQCKNRRKNTEIDANDAMGANDANDEMGAKKGGRSPLKSPDYSNFYALALTVFQISVYFSSITSEV